MKPNQKIKHIVDWSCEVVTCLLRLLLYRLCSDLASMSLWKCITLLSKQILLVKYFTVTSNALLC